MGARRGGGGGCASGGGGGAEGGSQKLPLLSLISAQVEMISRRRQKTKEGN